MMGNGLAFQESVDLSKECDPLVSDRKENCLILKEIRSHVYDCQNYNPHHTEVVPEQQICWHLGHAICLEVLCHICCRLMPGGTWVLSRWLCWEHISYIWFLESIKPSGKLSVLQSREVREEREDESRRTSFAVRTAKGSGNVFYFNCIFQALGSFWLFLLEGSRFYFSQSKSKKQAEVVVESRHLILFKLLEFWACRLVRDRKMALLV